VAKNSWVQQRVGNAAAEKAKDKEFQQKAGDAAISGAKSGATAANNNKGAVASGFKKFL